MNISQRVVILSAETLNATVEGNRQRTETLRGCLQDCNMNFSQAVGVYKGKEETSFVVVVRDEEEIEALKGFAFLNFNQESILLQDANQEAYLVFNDGETQRLGRLEQVSKEVATKEDAYTILNGQYYITRPRLGANMI